MYLTVLKKLILKIFSFLTLTLLLLIVSCKKEDNEVEPPRDIQEQSTVDDQSLEDFLSTHFYNYDDFQCLGGPENGPQARIANQNALTVFYFATPEVGGGGKGVGGKGGGGGGGPWGPNRAPRGAGGPALARMPATGDGDAHNSLAVNTL